MPANVTRGIGFLRNIQEDFAKEFFTESQVDEMVDSLESLRLTPSSETDREHLANFRVIQFDPEGCLCPKCGGKMVERVARRGKNAGNTFWGCSNFPLCRFTRG